MRLTTGDRPMGVDLLGAKTAAAAAPAKPKAAKKNLKELKDNIDTATAEAPTLALNLLEQLAIEVSALYTFKPTVELADAEVHIDQLRRTLRSVKL